MAMRLPKFARSRHPRTSLSGVFVPLLLVAGWLAISDFAAAQQVQVQSGIRPRQAILGEPITYIVSINIKTKDDKEIALQTPKPPEGAGYTLEFVDQNTSGGSEMSIVNGRMSQRITRRIDYRFLLKPKAAGDVIVPAFRHEIAGRNYRVAAAQTRISKEAPGNQFVDLAVTVDPPRPYVNQAVTARFRVTIRKSIVETAFDIPWASTPNGFFAEELALKRPSRRSDSIRINLNGQSMRVPLGADSDDRRASVIEIQRKLYPIAPGRVELAGSAARIELATKLGRDLFGNPTALESAKAVRMTEPLVIEVRDAPVVGRPASFTGVVGDFTGDLRLGKTEIKTGDGVTMTLIIRGAGDLEGIEAPEIAKDFEAFDVYPPDKEVDEEKRTVSFSWLIVPRNSADVKEFPRFEFSWFKPSPERFETVGIGPAKLVITGEMPDDAIFHGGTSSGLTTAVKTLSEGLSPLAAAPGNIVRAGSQRLSLGWLFAVVLLPIMSLVLTGFVMASRRRAAGDESIGRRRRASKEAKTRLDEAKTHLDQGGDVYGSLSKSLTGFIADKIGIPPGAVTITSVESLLAEAGTDAALSGRVKTLLEEFDNRRFGVDDAGSDERRRAYEEVEKLVGSLDRGFKR